MGAGVWTGVQLEIVAIMSIDLSQFNGPVLGGAVDGNTVIFNMSKILKKLKNINSIDSINFYELFFGSIIFGIFIVAFESLKLLPVKAELLQFALLRLKLTGLFILLSFGILYVPLLEAQRVVPVKLDDPSQAIA